MVFQTGLFGGPQMKSQAAAVAPRAFPHIVSIGAYRNKRWLVEVGAAAPAVRSQIVHAFHGEGAINDAGEVTPVGRELILDRLTRESSKEKGTQCVVWSENACTYVMQDGSTVESARPPQGEPIYPEDYERVPATVIDVRYVRMPDTCDVEYICVRQLDADHVEISSGSPMMLGHFDELPVEGPGSELRRHLDENGVLIPPETFRGVKTTGTLRGHTLLGPVQPDADDIRIVAPWPQQVVEAAEGIVGHELPQGIREALWRAVEPTRSGMILVGAVEVA